MAQTRSLMMAVMPPCSSTREGSLRKSTPRTSHFQIQQAPQTQSSRSCSKPSETLFHVIQPNGPVCQRFARVSPKRPPLACTVSRKWLQRASCCSPHQRERLRDEVEVRQCLWLPSLSA